MRQMISGLVAAAAIAVMAASAAPAMACGGVGLYQGGCLPCGQALSSPCAPAYVPAPVFSGCNSGCGGGWGYERLPDPVQQYQEAEPVHQYYYADQGPTYTGPGDRAPYPVYREGGVYGWSAYRHHSYYDGYYAHPHFRSHRFYRYPEHLGYYAHHRVLRRYY